ncbi:MAG: HD domain-containing protein [Armatimonadota bacterium]|nr:HD domain-containing protein [Armatimonadota bacterium]
MDQTREVRVYVGLVGAAAAALLSGLFAGLPPLLPDAGPLIVFSLGTVLVPVAGYCPVCLGPNVAVNMAGAVMFAMILLLPPAYATLGAALGIASLSVVQRWPAGDVAFNAGQTALTVGGTAWLLQRAGVTPLTGELDLLQTAWVLAGIGTFFTINSLVVTRWASLLHRSSFVHHWRQTFGRAAVPYVSTLLLGAVIALTYVHAPVLTAVLVLPLVAVYRALQTASALRRQARATMEMLADTIDRRDTYTFAHSQRVAALARRIARRLGLPADEQEAIAEAARVHDLGKVGISDALLLKADRLSSEELETVRKHTVIGAEIVGKLPEYRKGKEYILFHHERYDGTGVFRLYGQHIPLGARIIAAADAFDAMTSDRPYRRALSVEEALAEIARQKGRQFDPVVAEALIDIVRQESDAVFAEIPATPAATTQPSPAPS